VLPFAAPYVALYSGLAAIGHLFGKRHNCRFTPYGAAARRTRLSPRLFTALVALARLFRWRAFGWRMVFTAIVLGAAYTVFSERLNVEIWRSWSYTAAMPVLPLLGTGLTPLLQWLVVPGLAFAVSARQGRAARRLL
jgi:hypothetical protein